MLPLILTSIVTITQPSPKPPILTLTRTSIHFTDSFLCRGFSPERGTEFREDWLSLRDTCSCSYWSNIGCLLWRPSSHFSSHVYEKVSKRSELFISMQSCYDFKWFPYSFSTIFAIETLPKNTGEKFDMLTLSNL